MPTSKLCPRCQTIGVQSRLKRIYYRISGKYTELGWFCPSCMNIDLDIPSYLNDYNRIFGTSLTEPEIREQVLWTNKRIAALEKLDLKKKRDERVTTVSKIIEFPNGGVLSIQEPVEKLKNDKSSK